MGHDGRALWRRGPLAWYELQGGEKEYGIASEASYSLLLRVTSRDSIVVGTEYSRRQRHPAQGDSGGFVPVGLCGVGEGVARHIVPGG